MRISLLSLPFLLTFPLLAAAQFSTLTVATEQLSGPAKSPSSIAGAGGKLYGTFQQQPAGLYLLEVRLDGKVVSVPFIRL